jgi:serine phosphatase RsbU (regulator of sigma subunit)
MAFQFTIGRKLGLGFAVLIISTVFAFILTNLTLTDSKKKTDEVVNQITPSVAALEEFNILLGNSHYLITKWKYWPSADYDAFKDSLRHLISKDFPELKIGLDSLKTHWEKSSQLKLDSITQETDNLFKDYQSNIMSQLVGMDSYKDVNIVFMTDDALEEIDNRVLTIFNQLRTLVQNQKTIAKQTTVKMYSAFTLLQNIVKGLGIGLVLGGILIAFFTVRSIVKPLKHLKVQLNSMSLGILPTERMAKRNDEIGDMNIALNELIDSMERTTQFAGEVGSGNFDSYFKPLSEKDSLGHALLRMRTDLAENERVLEQKVIERTEEVVRQKEEIVAKNQELEVLYKHVTDSIRYAKRIQEAILPPDNFVKRVLPQSFILYKPKDIVSGDFYWVDEKEGKTFFAAVDCTGHGVPGAFMSIVGYNLLKEIITNGSTHTPASVMLKMKQGVSKTLNHGQSEDNNAKDGMDMSMCSINYENLELNYSGAYNPLYLIRDGKLTQYTADKFPVGYMEGTEDKTFTNNVIQLQKGDTIYIFSDGYADQFGGPKGKKLMVSNFRELLIKASAMPIADQKQFLFNTFEQWRGEHEQVDDILVMGVKV